MKKILNLVITALFFVNNISFALSPSPASDNPATQDKIFTIAENLFTARHIGPEKKAILEHVNWLTASLELASEGISNFRQANWSSPPDEWTRNSINKILIETGDVIEALKQFTANKPNLDIEKIALPPLKDKVALGECHIYPATGKIIIKVDDGFVRMLEDIIKHDIWYDRLFPDGEKETISVALSIFYYFAEVLPILGIVSPIDNRYADNIDAARLWFAHSYLLSDTQRYDNEELSKRLRWVFYDQDGKEICETAKRYPNLVKEDKKIEFTTKLALAINYHYFISRPSVKAYAPELPSPPPGEGGVMPLTIEQMEKLKVELEKRKPFYYLERAEQEGVLQALISDDIEAKNLATKLIKELRRKRPLNAMNELLHLAKQYDQRFKGAMLDALAEILPFSPIVDGEVIGKKKGKGRSPIGSPEGTKRVIDWARKNKLYNVLPPQFNLQQYMDCRDIYIVEHFVDAGFTLDNVDDILSAIQNLRGRGSTDADIAAAIGRLLKNLADTNSNITEENILKAIKAISGVSKPAVRRDFAKLVKAGKLVRIGHGIYSYAEQPHGPKDTKPSFLKIAIEEAKRLISQGDYDEAIETLSNPLTLAELYIYKDASGPDYAGYRSAVIAKTGVSPTKAPNLDTDGDLKPERINEARLLIQEATAKGKKKGKGRSPIGSPEGTKRVIDWARKNKLYNVLPPQFNLQQYMDCRDVYIVEHFGDVGFTLDNIDDILFMIQNLRGTRKNIVTAIRHLSKDLAFTDFNIIEDTLKAIGGVSESTVKRDLAELVKAGKLIRIKRGLYSSIESAKASPIGSLEGMEKVIRWGWKEGILSAQFKTEQYMDCRDIYIVEHVKEVGFTEENIKQILKAIQELRGYPWFCISNEDIYMHINQIFRTDITLFTLRTIGKVSKSTVKKHLAELVNAGKLAKIGEDLYSSIKVENEVENPRIIDIVINIARNKGIVNEAIITREITSREREEVLKALNLLYQSQIEIIMPQRLELSLTKNTRMFMKGINKRHKSAGKKDIFELSGFSGAHHLMKLLKQNKPGVKRIVIVPNRKCGKEIESILNINGELYRHFAGVKLLNVTLPKKAMDEKDKTAHQVRLMMIAILARLLENETREAKFIKPVLKDMLEGHVEGISVGDFIDELGKPDTSDINEIKERIINHLGKYVVSLVDWLDKELQRMTLLCKYA
ncbi:MAG: hypothetical protein JSV93_05080 [Candidatus Omnitrophota bacterium]|nr:MAG: hypothetical protein JSV93_05080 [Candidatus Omnitrophota bacterium]